MKNQTFRTFKCNSHASLIQLSKQFSSRFTQFRSFEEIAKFIKCSGAVTLDKLNLEWLQFIDLNNFETRTPEPRLLKQVAPREGEGGSWVEEAI
jgi:hypothetical protein